jgi:hypothetical protein
MLSGKNNINSTMDNNVIIRTAAEIDQENIEYFLSHAAAIHRHLDWRTPFEWLGNKDFLIEQNKQAITGMLICTAEPDEVHWVRVFGSIDFQSLDQCWQHLFNAFLDQAASSAEPLVVATIAYFEWMQDLMEQNNWKLHQRVVQLKWNSFDTKNFSNKWPEGLSIRPMSVRDLATVTRIDQECFPFIWKQSQDVINHAFDQSSYTTVALLNGEIVGFQISTAYKTIAHLARLAVTPQFQGYHIGQALVQNMLHHFSKPWIHEIP